MSSWHHLLSSVCLSVFSLCVLLLPSTLFFYFQPIFFSLMFYSVSFIINPSFYLFTISYSVSLPFSVKFIFIPFYHFKILLPIPYLSIYLSIYPAIWLIFFFFFYFFTFLLFTINTISFTSVSFIFLSSYVSNFPFSIYTNTIRCQIWPCILTYSVK